MIIKIPVYYRLEVSGQPSLDQDLVREKITSEVNNVLRENLKKIIITRKGPNFDDSDRVEAFHTTISEVHEILRTKK